MLDRRGRRCLDESLLAARRGLFLSSVNLFGSVSESAWFGIASRLEPAGRKITDAISQKNASRVILLTADRLRQTKGQGPTVDEVLAHASYLRDLRNYGVHPFGDPELGQEDAFAEPGCMLLIMNTHRYLARLYRSALAAGVDFSAADNA